jgi:type II restriction enzyme
MGIDLSGYETDVREAVKLFWERRDAARTKQQGGGRADQGERSGVTAGKNMDGFVELVEKVVRTNGLPDAKVHLQRRVLTLPGYFRPTKLWDMLVTHRGHLVAAIEFKSQVGPSFGNNFNNRTEEALGTAVDFWKVFREGGFGESPAPFAGWMILVEDAPRSRSPVRDLSPHYPVFPEFEGASYADRYNILCRKLVQEKLYTSASVLLSPRSAADTGDYEELSEFTGFKRFISQLAGHVAAEST